MVLYFDSAYLVLGVAFTMVVSRLLKRHGAFFLGYIFPQKSPGAHALMALLDIGFYLINFGYIFIRLAYGPRDLQDPADLFRTFSGYFGWQCLLVGVVHFFNMAIFSAKIPKKKIV